VSDERDHPPVGTVLLKGTEHWHELDLKQLLDNEYQRGYRQSVTDNYGVATDYDQPRRQAAKYRCCPHCTDDPVHDVAPDAHDFPCNAPDNSGCIGRLTASTQEDQ